MLEKNCLGKDFEGLYRVVIEYYTPYTPREVQIPLILDLKEILYTFLKSLIAYIRIL